MQANLPVPVRKANVPQGKDQSQATRLKVRGHAIATVGCYCHMPRMRDLRSTRMSGWGARPAAAEDGGGQAQLSK